MNHPICTDPQGYAICASCRKNPENYQPIQVMHPHQKREKPNAWDGKCTSWEAMRNETAAQR